jgi:hypothetical protein
MVVFSFMGPLENHHKLTPCKVSDNKLTVACSPKDAKSTDSEGFYLIDLENAI